MQPDDGFLIVSERFGPTIQGEGPSAGRPAMFLRLGMCNLDCRVCDTPYTWDWTGQLGTRYDRKTELSHLSMGEATEWVHANCADRLLVITGGEPLIQRKALEQWLPTVVGACDIEVETNGTLPPLRFPWQTLAYNVSPKTPAMLNGAAERLEWDSLHALAEHGRALSNVRWKFVVRHMDDVRFADMIATRLDLPRRKVWLMPEGVDAAEQTATLGWLANMAAQLGYNVSPRLHVMAWGNRRGV